MKITEMFIRNFKSVKYLSIKNIDNALILVGKNSTGKTVILDALLAVAGLYKVNKSEFHKDKNNIEICLTLEITDNDLKYMNATGKVSKYKRFDRWMSEFQKAFPGYHEGRLSFIWVMNYNGQIRYQDEFSKDNHYIPEILPRIFFLDKDRDLSSLQEELFLQSSLNEVNDAIENRCVFDAGRKCNKCFNCIPAIAKKDADKLSIPELKILMDYRLYTGSSGNFSRLLDDNFYKNSGYTRHLKAEYKTDSLHMFNPEIHVYDTDGDYFTEYEKMSAGMKSLYALSLLETYVETAQNIPFIILIEDPELFLHPSLQKNACEILSKLSKKNQVFFSTHSPNMLFNFNPRNLCQVMLDKNGNTVVNAKADIDIILDDLGYAAGDLLNVGFVFFVEGKQDRNRLPLLLKKYYSDMQDENGIIKRMSIITTNSCTNIKTYANLKYINQLYIKDQFMMIRDGDGKDKNKLISSLCSYYKGREADDKGYLPSVTEKNVLVLKYYSFENYFLFPEIMAQIGVIPDTDTFYEILFAKYNEYLSKISSFKKLEEKLGHGFSCPEDFKKDIENIRIYVRGHNLYDIFYGKFKGDSEENILNKYIDAAPRAIFEDILSAIERFTYFDNRKL